MEIPSLEYIQEFQGKLGDAVSKALSLDNPILGGLTANALYLTELQMSAAIAGYRLGIPQELSIAYMVSMEAVSYEKSINKLALAFSGEKRERYETHRKLLSFVAPLAEQLSDTRLSDQFFRLFMEELERS